MVDLVVLQSLSYMAGALGVCVAAAYYVMNLRMNQKNQELSLKTQQQTLETRQAQMFMNIYQQTTTKEFASAWNTYISSEWKNYDEYWNLVQKKEFTEPFTIICMYFEGLGVLVKEGFLPIRLVALLLTGMTRAFWEKLMPINADIKVKAGYVRWMSETAYLYDELLRYIGEHPELATEYRNPPKPK
jgi:hypothetical protein